MNEDQAAKKFWFATKIQTRAEYEHRRQQAYRVDRTVKRPTKWAALNNK